MTITTMPMGSRSVDEASQHLPARCDVCGAAVTDFSEHLAECVDHELERFAAGRHAS